MSLRRLVIAGTVTALAAGPVVLAAGAEATPPFSVSVEHCGGGIAIVGFNTLRAATRADLRAIRRQVAHPHSVKTVQLFQGRHTIKVSTKHC